MSLEKKTFSIFAIFLIIGLVFSFPMILAQDNSGPSNDDDDMENDSDDVNEEDIINAVIFDEDDDFDDDKEDEDDESEMEVEIEDEEGERKFKFKAKGEMNENRIRAALQARNRIHANGTNLPENCTRAGSTIKCGVNEALRTRVDVESNLQLTENLRNMIHELRISFDELDSEAEVEIEVQKDESDEEENESESEIEIESDVEGPLSDAQLNLVEDIVQEASSIVSDSDSEEAEIKIEIKRDYERQRTMAIVAGQSGNIILQSKGVNASTNVQLYHHNGSVFGVFDGNVTKAIELLPDEIKEMIKERIRAQISENETEIELEEDGEYEVRTRKEARFLGLFKVKERMRLKVDPTTGEVLSERAPWWGFLANDIEDEDEFVSETNTTETNSTQ